MPTVKLAHQSDLSPTECFSRVSKLFETDVQLRGFDPHFKCEFDHQAHTGTAVGKQFKARMKVQPAAQGSTLELEVDLPFHLGLVKGMVQKTLEKKLAAVLG
jgi:hypothetical protein